MTTPERPDRLTPLLLLAVVAAVLWIGWMAYERSAEEQQVQESRTRLAQNQATQSRLSELHTFTGDGDHRTAPEHFSGGPYEATAFFDDDCTYYLALVSNASGERTDLVAYDQAGEKSNWVYSLPEGDYHVSAITGPSCGWKVNVAAR